MTKTTNAIARHLAIAMPLILDGSVWAQQPADPAAAPVAPANAADSGPAIETNPSVRAALELPRETPADHFQAIGWLIDLGRPALAQQILEELSQLQLTDSQRVALVSEFGPQRMLQLAGAKELAPAGAEFADACMTAAAAAANNPQRIAQLVTQLTDASAEVRELAGNDLAAVGQVGVTATLEALAREPDRARRDALLTAAADMHPLVVGPLLAMLSTNDPTLRADISQLLKHLGVTQAIPLLPASPASAERALNDAIDRYAAGTPPFASDEHNQVELWFWNDGTKRLASDRYATEEARIIWSARLARGLARLRPENIKYRRHAWLLGLEADGIVSGDSQPATRRSPAVATLSAVMDEEFVNQLLADALEANYPHAAVAAADSLGERGETGVLLTADGRLSPLARALVSPNRGVRFAALRAIMTLDPKAPYPGSSRVPEALAWFALSDGERRALVAMPTNLMATDLAGMLSAHGVHAEATNRGRDAVDMAGEMPDIEMIFVDINILKPDVRQVVYELRTQSTTAAVPIALLAADGRLEAAQRLAAEHDRVIAVPRLHSADILARTVEELETVAGRDAPTPGERAAQSVQAMTWLMNLVSAGRPFYEWHRAEPAIETALYRPDAAKLAVTTLARLNTADSQRTLVNFASQNTFPIASRSQAAEAFRASVSASGLRLTSDEILTQYDRYNASESADAQTQHVLGSLLDTIESRRDAARPARIPAP